MLSQRPFRDRDDVFDSAERIWWDLSAADWLEAFAAHPRIGEKRQYAQDAQDVRHAQDAQDAQNARDAQSARWSEQEQVGVAQAGDDVRRQLAEANAEYERRFGYIYIVCATGRSAEEMLAMCRYRLSHDPATELKVAAGEQAKITRLRLEKLLGEP